MGNSALKQQLSAQSEGRGLCHAYLITGPKGSGKQTLSQLIAAAMVCSGDRERPCGACSHCRKVSEGIHPDVIHVDLPAGKREILVEQARQMRADAMIRPNEAERKVYIVHSAGTMNRSAQNAILKLLEEGPNYAAFFFLTENPASMLPTIRSRCEHLSLAPVAPEEALSFLRQRFPDKSVQELQKAAVACGGILGQAVDRLAGTVEEEAVDGAGELVDAFASGDELLLMAFCCTLERKKLPRDTFCHLLDEASGILRDALTIHLGAAAGSGISPAAQRAAQRPTESLLQASEAFQRVRRDVDFNVNMGHLCAALCARLGEVLSQETNLGY